MPENFFGHPKPDRPLVAHCPRTALDRAGNARPYRLAQGGYETTSAGSNHRNLRCPYSKHHPAFEVILHPDHPVGEGGEGIFQGGEAFF